jgi:hypothetical protein
MRESADLVLCIYTKLMPDLQWGEEVVVRDAVLAWSHRSVWSCRRLVYSTVNMFPYGADAWFTVR